MAAGLERCLAAGPLAEEVTRLAALQAELSTRLEYEPAEKQVELMLRIVDAALSVIDEAGCFARYVLQRVELEIRPAY